MLSNEAEKNPMQNDEANKANENPETKPAGQSDDGDDGKDKSPSVEQLMAELAKANADKAKLKNSLDEASSEAAKFKKALREKQSAEEIKSEEELKAQEEHKKYVAELEAFKKKAEAEARYALQGMSKDLAMKAAEAEVNGDMDELAAIQKKHTESLLKEKEKEWLKSRPDVNIGNGDGDENSKLEKQIESIMLGNNGLFSQQL